MTLPADGNPGCEEFRLSQCLQRRQVLRIGGLTGMALLLPDLLRARAAADSVARGSFGRAKSVILLYLHGGHAYYGVLNYLQPRAVEAYERLVILMHDADKTTDDMLSNLIDTLRGLGANFHPLPRPIDGPNASTVGIAYPPTVRSVEWL